MRGLLVCFDAWDFALDLLDRWEWTLPSLARRSTGSGANDDISVEGAAGKTLFGFEYVDTKSGLVTERCNWLRGEVNVDAGAYLMA